MKKSLALILFMSLLGQSLISQPTLNIAIIKDYASSLNQELEDQIKLEIENHLSTRYDISYQLKDGKNSLLMTQKLIEESFQDSSIDLIIGLGLRVCGHLGKMDSFPKPTILTIILDNDLQGIPISAQGTSGVPNLTYVQSPFNLERDFKTLTKIIDYKKIAIIGSSDLDIREFNFDKYFSQFFNDSETGFERILIGDDEKAIDILNHVNNEFDAAYMLPVDDNFTFQELTTLYKGLAEKGIPTFSLISHPQLSLGAYAAYESNANFQRIPRRVGLNVLKIIEGIPAQDLSVEMGSFTENLIINMQTARECKVYPDWDMMAQSILFNVNKVNTKRSLNLRSAIFEGLKNNLDLQISQKESEISEMDVDLAKSNFLPQLDATASILSLDRNTINNAFGTKGYFNLSGNATLSQIVFSEPAMANVAIQKILYESQQKSVKQSEQDIVLEVADAYLNIMRALSLVSIQNQNVSVTRKNYDIAQAKEKVGYGATNDVYRWESELSLDNIDLNNARVQLDQAKYYLNFLLNRSIKEPFILEDISLSDNILLVMDEKLYPLINNQGDLEIFADFIVKEGFANLPEIDQMELTIAAQERSLLSQKRSFYSPSIGLASEYDLPIDHFSLPDGVNKMDGKANWFAGLSVKLPIFQGNSRKIQQEQTQLALLQLEDQINNLRNNLELRIRSNLRAAGASFSNLELSRKASEAAEKNFEIAQDSYQQGLLNITSLIDAQNASLQAEINSTNASFTFIGDFLAMERSMGYYHFLATDVEKESFYRRFFEFMFKNQRQ